MDPLRLTRLKRLVRSNRLRFLLVLLADLTGARHLIVRLDPVMACNIRCAMCYFSDEAWYGGHANRRFTAGQIGAIADAFFGSALQVHIGCGAEPTMYKGYGDLVRLAKRRGVPFVSLATNAQLLRPDDLRRLIDDGLDEIVVSVHGTTRATYETLMAGARFDVLHKVLATLTAMKRASGTGRPRLRLNYTVNPDNLAELPAIFEVFQGYDLAVLQVRPIIDLGDTSYHNKDMAAVRDRYRQVMAGLRDQAGRLGVTLLGSLGDPSYGAVNPDAAAYLSVLRAVSPERVWRDGFDPLTMSYGAFKKSIGYRRELLRAIVHGAPAVSGQPLASSDVL